MELENFFLDVFVVLAGKMVVPRSILDHLFMAQKTKRSQPFCIP